MRPLVLFVGFCVVLLSSTLMAADLSLLSNLTIAKPVTNPTYGYINLTGQSISDRHLRNVPEQSPDLSVVQELYLGKTQVTDAGLGELRKFPNLKVLYLHNTRVSDKGLEILQRLSKLERLNLRGCVRVTNSGLVHLKELPLTWLDIQATKVTNEGLVHLSPNLTSLTIGNGLGPYVTDAGMPHLAKLEQLKKLDLTMAQVTNDGLKHLLGLARLQQLDLPAFSDIDDAGIQQLASLPSLASLDVTGTLISNDGLGELLKFPALVKVSVGGSTKNKVRFTNVYLTQFWKQLKEKRTRLQVVATTEK